MEKNLRVRRKNCGKKSEQKFGASFFFGQLCPISDFAKKTRGRRSISDKIGETEEKSWMEISRGSGPTPVTRGGSGAKAHPLAARPVPWNGRGWRLVELTDGCYSGGDSQGLPG